MIQAGVEPDMWYTWPPTIQRLLQMGVLLPVDSVVEDLGDFLPSVIDMVRFEGKVWGVPLAMGGWWQWYRRDLYAENGLLPPKYESDVLAAAEKLTMDTDGDGTIDIYGVDIVGQPGFISQVYFIQRFWNANGYLFDEQNRIAFSTKYRKETLQALDYMKRLTEYSPPGFLSHGFMETRKAFAQGLVAQLETNARLPGNIIDINPDLEFKVGVVDAVIPRGGAVHLWGGPDVFVVAKKTKYPEVCKNFAKFSVSGDFYVEWLLSVPFHLLPTRTSIFADPGWAESKVIKSHPEWKKPLLDSLPRIRGDMTCEHPGVLNPMAIDVFTTYSLADNLSKFYVGQISAEELLDDTARDWADWGDYELAPAQ